MTDADILNIPNLVKHLDRRGLKLDLDFKPERFANGFGNINLLMMIDGKRSVLRRPPLGPLPPGANDMAREYKIISHLQGAFPKIPRAFHFCGDETVIGAPFFIMDYCPGRIIGGQWPADIESNWRGSAPIGKFISRNLLDLLSQLHSIPPASVGLQDLSKPVGFAARNVRGWKKRAQLAWEGQPPLAVQKMVEWLEPNIPHDGDLSLIHNDFKLDNVILDSQTLAPKAVIDWDMGALGNPLYDLAILLSYWTEKDDPASIHDLKQMPTAGHGFLTREEVSRLYADISGRDLTNLLFFRVLASLRLAVVFKQLHRRYLAEGTKDPRFIAFDDLAIRLAEFGVDVMHNRYL